MAEPSLVGHQLGKYQIQAVIGRGGMGTIYLGYDPQLDRQVAIKALAPHLVWDTECVQRFLREARAAARLAHPNIVTIHDVGQESENYYFVMAYLTGQDLEQYIHQHSPLTSEEILSVLSQVADALDYAHRGGWVHRDIKPANIFVGWDGHVTLTDFGIARAKQDARLTATGTVIGTPQYIAPEQVRNLPAGPQSDLYSLGVVAYQMLSGQVPFDADSTVALLYKIVHEPPAPIRATRPDLNEAVEQVLAKMLAKEPGDRYPTAIAFAQALRLALQEGTGVATTVADASATIPEIPALSPDASAIHTRPQTPQSSPIRHRDTPRKPRQPTLPIESMEAAGTPAAATALPTSRALPGTGVTPSEASTKPRRLHWLWLGAAAAVLVILAASGLFKNALVAVLPAVSPTIPASANTPTDMPTLTPTLPSITLSEFAPPSASFRADYPSTWRPAIFTETGSLTQLFQSQEVSGTERIWVAAAATTEGAARLAAELASRIESQPNYILLRNSRPADAMVLREARYTDAQGGDVHVVFLIRVQGRTAGMVSFAVSEKHWAEYASVAESIVRSLSVEEAAALRVLVTPTATMIPTATRRPPTPTRIPPTATPSPTATEKPEKDENGSGPPPPPPPEP